MSIQRVNNQWLDIFLSLRACKNVLRKKTKSRLCHDRQRRIESTSSVPLNESLAIGARSIVLDAARRNASIVLQNVGNRRIIVYPSIQRCPESHAASVMVNPPSFEIAAGAATLLNYVTVLTESDTEQLFRARFEWMYLHRDYSEQHAEKSIPLLVRPYPSNGLTDPRECLTALVSRYGDVIIENHSSEIAFLSPAVYLLPSNKSFIVPQLYIAPNSWLLARSVCEGIPTCAIRVTVETLDGAAISSVDIPLRSLNCIKHG